MLRNRKQNGSGSSSPRYPGSPTSASGTPTGSPRILVTRGLGSPRSEVGEIDTRSPFQSVRAAVCLFGDAGSSPKKTKLTIKRKSKTPEERVKEKESQLNLALRELDNFKQQIRSTEATKGHALRELEIAKRALRELTVKLITLCKSKQASIEATEAAKVRTTELEHEIKSNKFPAVDALKHINTEHEKLMAKKEAEEETNKAIQLLQEQLDNVRASDLDVFTKASSELDVTKEALQTIDAEKMSSKSLVDSLQVELDILMGHNSELKRKASEAEALAENLRVDLDNSKKELVAKKQKVDATDDASRIQQFTSEAVHFLHEAEEMKKKAELLRQEAETARAAEKEAEETLKEAKQDACSESNGKIKMEVEKYEAVTKKAEEIRNEADIKVATAMAQVETISANEKEVLAKVEACLKEKRDIEDATKEALKEAGMAEAAKKAIEGQMQKKPSKAARVRSWRFFK